MENKCYPFPEDLINREIKRKTAGSERLKRMTNLEEKTWEQEAVKKAMSFLIDEKIKPAYPMIRANVLKQLAKCDSDFDILLEQKTKENGKENPGVA